MLQALAQYRIVGVANNVEFLSRLVACPAFAHADLDTGLIERERAFLFPEAADAPDQAYLIAALATLLREEEARARPRRGGDPYSPWRMQDGWRLNSRSERRLVFRFGETERTVVVGYGDGGYDLTPRRRHGAGARRARPQRHAARRARRACGSTRA